MKTNRIIQAVFILVVLSIPCYAIRSMMFNSINQYIERASGIWIVEVLRQAGQEPEIGPAYEGKILQSLKGEPQKEPLSFCAISRQLAVGKRYLVFGFGTASGGTWLDNGNVSPVEIPSSLSLAELEGKPAKEQMLAILVARCAEIEEMVRQLNDEKKTIEDGISFQKRLDQLPGKEK